MKPERLRGGKQVSRVYELRNCKSVPWHYQRRQAPGASSPLLWTDVQGAFAQHQGPPSWVGAHCTPRWKGGSIKATANPLTLFLHHPYT